MTLAVPQPLTITQFLQLPYIEDSPAWEFIQGEAIQKPMPGGKHSRLQVRLGGAISAINSPYEALPELRCTFEGRSIVPEIAVLAKERAPIDAKGDIISTGIDFPPDWAIEILSPGQSQTQVTRKILHSLRHGCQLGWLVDADERLVLAYYPNALPDELTGDAQLPSLPGLDLDLTVAQLFDWLKVVSR